MLEVTDLENKPEEVNPPPSPTCPWSDLKLVKVDTSERSHFTVQLLEAFWRMHSCRPVNPLISPVGMPGKFCDVSVNESKQYPACPWVLLSVTSATATLSWSSKSVHTNSQISEYL